MDPRWMMRTVCGGQRIKSVHVRWGDGEMGVLRMENDWKLWSGHATLAKGLLPIGDGLNVNVCDEQMMGSWEYL